MVLHVRKAVGQLIVPRIVLGALLVIQITVSYVIGENWKQSKCLAIEH